MIIRLLKPYIMYPAGEVIDTFGDPVCELLIQRGVAEQVIEQRKKAKHRRGCHVETTARANPRG